MQTETENRPSDKNRVSVGIPYVQGLSERVKKTLKPYGITTYFKPCNKLRQKLVNIKDKQPKEKRSHIVYGIKCEDPGCQETYIGETQQSLKARMNQHRKPSTAGENYSSAVFAHLDITGHSFKTENVVILDREGDWFRRGVKEAIWERVENPTLNKKGACAFNYLMFGTLLSEQFLVVSHLGIPQGRGKVTCLHVNNNLHVQSFSLKKSSGSGRNVTNCNVSSSI